MRQLLARALCAALIVLASLPAFAQRRVALVIGNDAYRSVPALHKAVSDAGAVGETLEALGFDVTRAENLTQRAMSETFARFDGGIKPGDTAFFFFAGHGFEVKGLNYLLPVDVPAVSEGQEDVIRDAAFAVDELVDRLQRRGVGTAILVLDACRDDPFGRPGRRGLAAPAGLAPMTPPEGVFVIYSAGAKQEALDQLSDQDRDPNSVFTRFFARNLRLPGLSLVQVAKRTQAEVKRLAASVRHDQTPAYYDEIVGDVVLSGSGQGTAALPPPYPALPQIASLPPQGRTSLPIPPVLAPDTNNPPVNGPLVSFSRSNAGWQGSVSLPEPALGIAWRFGPSGPFQDMGLSDDIDQRTGRRRPNANFQLDPGTPAGTIDLRYVDPAGILVGPFRIAFEPRSALVQEQRRVLDMIAGSWLSFRDFNGVLVYYSALVSYRCAIREMRIGIDKPMPDRAVTLPRCDEANPFAIPDDVLPYLKVPASTRSVSIQLRYLDGSASPVKVFRR